MNERKPSLKLNAALNSTQAILSVLFPLITYPYVTRVLFAENLGKVNFASSVVGYFSLIAGLGISAYASREGVQFRNDRKKLTQFCSEVFTLNIITAIASLLLLAVSCVAVPRFHSYTMLMAIYSLTIVFSTVGMGWLYVVEEDYLYMTTKSIAIQAITLVLMFVVVRDQDDFYQYAFLNVLSNVGTNVLNLFYCRRYIDLKITFKLKKVFSHVKSSLVFFSSSIASSIYSNIDTTMLGFFTSDFYVGVYGVAVKIYVMIKTLLGAVTSVMIPRLTSYVANGEKEEFNKLISTVFKLMWTFLLPVMLGVILVANELIWLISGPGFEGAVSALQILSFAIFFAMFATVINGSILIPNKQEKNALKTTVAAAIVNASLNFAAIPLFQQNGAAATTVLAECVVMALGWYYARRLVQLEDMKKTILTSLVGCVAIAAVCFLVEMIPVGLVLRLGLKVCLSVAAYFVALLATGNALACQAVKMVRKKIGR